MMIFYTHPQSRGRITHWMLEEVAEPYETRVLDYASSMKAPDYLAINPMGKVPALVLNGEIITEGAAIITTLAEAFPKAGLMPANRGSFYRWMFFGAGPLESAITNTALGVTVPADRQGMVGYGSLDRVTDTLAAHLAQTPFLCGDQFSAADVYVGSQIGYGLRFKTLDARPAFVDYWARISTRPALLRANALNDALLKG